jgi:hypothetical protein
VEGQCLEKLLELSALDNALAGRDIFLLPNAVIEIIQGSELAHAGDITTSRKSEVHVLLLCATAELLLQEDNT